jgi:hypothetical protein
MRNSSETHSEVQNRLVDVFIVEQKEVVDLSHVKSESGEESLCEPRTLEFEPCLTTSTTTTSTTKQRPIEGDALCTPIAMVEIMRSAPFHS